MSKNKKETTRLEDLADQSKPLGMESIDTTKPDKKQKSAVSSVTGTDSQNNTLSAAERDSAQHMKKIMQFVGGVGFFNTLMKRHRNKEYAKTLKSFKRFQEAYDSAKTNGQGGRSIEECYLEKMMKDRKEKLEAMVEKWPNLQKPTSMSQKFQAMFRTSKQGISEALRAQTMKGVAQANAGSDVRAVMAANAVGYIPGTEYQGSSEMTM